MAAWRNLCALTVFLAMAGAVRAETITLDAVARGWYRSGGGDSGYCSSTSANYMAGRLTSDCTAEYRNFFVFDLTSLAGTISGATLRLNTLGVQGSGETYSLYDATTPVMTLTAGGSGQSEIFADLGTGTVYGSCSIQASEHDSYVEIPLSVEFVSAANMANDWFAIGGTLTLPQGTSDLYVFGYPGEKPLNFTQLVVTTVPEPGMLALGLSSVVCLLGSVCYRRRR
ncbi:MAG: hypothetical protein LLG00_15445 [Planctomycetaceae bacterium]|nr:hypothetical protein [Planctomycetaceae bacterium]